MILYTNFKVCEKKRAVPLNGASVTTTLKTRVVKKWQAVCFFWGQIGQK